MSHPIRAILAYPQSESLPRRTCRFHDLRHTAATLLLAVGEHPKVVQEMLGHSSIALTVDTYSHVLPYLKKQAAAKVDEILAASENKAPR